MKVLICYFSGTGNTEKIAELYRSAFTTRGHEVEVISLPLSDGKTPDVAGYDLLGFGYPIHAFNAPKTMLDFCKSLAKRGKNAPSVRAFVFKTSGEPVRMSDVSSIKACKILKPRGITVTNEYQYVMPYNIIFRHSDDAVYKMWQTAQNLVPVDVEEIISGKSVRPRKMFMGGFLARILRAEHWGAHIIGKTYKTNKSCVKCGKCIKLCPVNNIKIKKSGKLKFGGKCIMCMRCSMFCPKNAVELGLLKHWKVNGEYSFAPPDPDAELPPDKHADYCAKAYARYYAAAAQKIAESRNGDAN